MGGKLEDKTLLKLQLVMYQFHVDYVDNGDIHTVYSAFSLYELPQHTFVSQCNVIILKEHLLNP